MLFFSFTPEYFYWIIMTLLGLSCCLDFLLLSVLLMDTIRRQMFCVVNVVVAVPRLLLTWEGIFYLQAFFTLHSLILFVLPKVQILEGVFYAQAFFTLHSFPPHFWDKLHLLNFPRELVVLPERLQGIHAEVWNTVHHTTTL